MSVSDTRLGQIAARFAELEARLASGTLEGPAFVTASRDYAELEPVARAAAHVSTMRGELAALSASSSDPDPEMRALAEEEIAHLRSELPEAERALRVPVPHGRQRHGNAGVRALAVAVVRCRGRLNVFPQGRHLWRVRV